MKKIFLLLVSYLMAVISVAQEKPEGLFINSKAPDFKSKDQFGREFRLKDALRDSLVVLVFYRGQWCPYCNRYLKKLEDSLLLVKAKGARLVAVSPEKPEFINKTVEKTGVSYPVLYDEEMKIMKAYQVAFQVDERTVTRYKSSDIDLEKAHGQTEKVYLPVPAVYIISKEGTILYRFFDTDYKKRPAVITLLDQLK